MCWGHIYQKVQTFSLVLFFEFLKVEQCSCWGLGSDNIPGSFMAECQVKTLKPVSVVSPAGFCLRPEDLAAQLPLIKRQLQLLELQASPKRPICLPHLLLRYSSAPLIPCSHSSSTPVWTSWCHSDLLAQVKAPGRICPFIC